MTFSQNLRLCGLAVILAAAPFGGTDSMAFDSVWRLPITSPWTTAGNWNPTGVPYADDDRQALVNNGGTATLAAVAPDVAGIALGVAAGQMGRILITGGSLTTRVPDPAIWEVPSSTLLGNVFVGGDAGLIGGAAAGDGRGYLDMSGGKMCVGTDGVTCVAVQTGPVNRPDLISTNNLTVGGEDLATGLGRSRVNLSGNAELHVTGTSSLSRNLRVTGPNVTFRTFGNVNFDAASIFTPEITAATHSPVRSDNVINLAGQVVPTFTAVTPAHNQWWTIAEAGSINGTFSNEVGATRDVIPTGVPAPVLGEAYRLRTVGGATGGNRQLQVGYQKLLVLTVNRTAGVESLTIRNPLGGPIAIDGYTISSAVGSLNTGWNSLDDQNIWGGDWQELAPTTNSLSEFKPSGTFAPGSSQSLGQGFDRDAVGAHGIGISGEDLVFEYTDPALGVMRGQVEYIGTPFCNNICLLVDPANGMARFKNDSGVSLDVEAYRIVSTTNSLTPGTWTPLEGQLPGWQAGTGSTFGLAEGMPVGSTTVAAQQFYPLGDIGDFATQAVKDGLSMEFILEGEANFRNATVQFTAFSGVPGDYNGNGSVDAGDYVLWRKGGPLQNEVDNPGTVNQADYTAWRARFGNTSGAGSGALAGSSAVPEPNTAWLVVLGLCGALFANSGRRSRQVVIRKTVDRGGFDHLGVQAMFGNFRAQLGGGSIVAKQLGVVLASVLTITLCLSTGSPSYAQNLLVNGDFEQQDIPGGFCTDGSGAPCKFETGYDVVADVPWGGATAPLGSDTPNWFDGAPVTVGDGTTTFRTDSGVERRAGQLPGSIIQAYINSANSRDDGLYANQTTSHVIGGVDAFILSVRAKPYFTFTSTWGEANATMHWEMYYGGDASTLGTMFAEGYFDLGVGNGDAGIPFELHQTSIVTPPPAALGSAIGISLYNTSGGWKAGDPAGDTPADPSKSWIAFDNVSLERVSSVFGDVDFDSDVDTDDLQIILDNMANSTASFWSEGDINGDDLVNLLDYRAWKSVYSPGAGAGTTSAGVPEPSTLALALVFTGGLYGITLRRRRPTKSDLRSIRPAAFALGLLAMSAIASPSLAQPLALTNPGFELPGTVKTEYWDAGGNIVPGIIPGWEPTGPGDPDVTGGPVPGPGDSGVEQGGVNDFDATVGDLNWQGYLAAQDPSIYTVSTTNIVANRNYAASVFAFNIFQSDEQAARMNLELFYVNASSVRVPLGNQNFVVGSGYTNYSFTLTAAQVAAGLGRPLGIEIDHVGDESPGRSAIQSWIGLDHVVLYADNVAGGIGDVNNNGVVDINDYNIIKTNFHQAVPSREMGDISGPNGLSDLLVDLYDLRAWKDSIGSGSGALDGGLGVPEPSSVILTVTIAPLVLGATCRRRKPRRRILTLRAQSR